MGIPSQEPGVQKPSYTGAPRVGGVCPIEVSMALMQVTTPLRIAEWEKVLVSHTDKEFSAYILRGLREGFRIGYKHDSHELRPASRNMQSAEQNKQVVEEYHAKEVAEGRVVGPLNPASILGFKFPHLESSQNHLSAPEGPSVNDGIDRMLSSLRYVSVGDVASLVQKLGRGARLAKMDVQAAYRNIPVHSDDTHLLGMQWEDQLFVDMALLFGLRSAPKLFTAIADALQWVVRSRGVSYIAHYLDDFIIVGPPGSEECAKNLDRLLETCRELGVPVACHKVEGPSTCIILLGIEIDTVAMELQTAALGVVDCRVEIP